MVIPGIPDDHVERIHCWLDPGKGSSYAYRHLPSGITVSGTLPPHMSVQEYDKRLFAEFIEELKAAGIINGETSNRDTNET